MWIDIAAGIFSIPLQGIWLLLLFSVYFFTIIFSIFKFDIVSCTFSSFLRDALVLLIHVMSLIGGN